MLSFSVPIIHKMKLNDKVMVINRDNCKRYVFSLHEYEVLINAIDQEELKEGTYKISMESSACKAVFECIIRGIFFTESKRKNKEIMEIGYGSPKVVYMFMTEQCNLRCVYCYKDATHVSKSNSLKKINIPKTKRLIDKITQMGVSEIAFTGGEPLLISEIFEIGEYAKMQGIYTCLLTNGTLISQQNVKHMTCFDVVKISLDSTTPFDNEKTRGKGSTKKILQGIHLVKELGVKVIIEGVINVNNYASIEKTLNDLYQNVGVDEVRLTYLVPEGRGEDNPNILQIPYDISQKYITDAHQQVLGDKYLSVMQKFTPQRQKLTIGCGAGINEILIDCDGDIYPCRMFHHDDYFMGNLMKESLREMQAKNSFQIFKQGLMVENIESCKNCTIKYICAGGCRPAHRGFSGNLKTNYVQLCAMTKVNTEQLLWLSENIDPISGLYINE